MTTEQTDDKLYEEARKRVKARRDFFGNLTAYIVINIALVLIWAFPAGGGYPWFLWPLGIWGIFVLVNFFQVFVFQQKSDIEAIEKEADRIRRERS